VYAFGHGLSYTRFTYGDLAATGGDTVTATFTVTNTGERRGAGIYQIALGKAADDISMTASATMDERRFGS
jgi:beta-glucosidase